MEFLKQLLGNSPESPHTSTSVVEEYSGVDTTNFSSFVIEANKKSRNPSVSKPRNKPLNDALLSKKSGAMPAKDDFSRAKVKRDSLQRIKELDEAASSGEKRFQYTAFDSDGKYVESGYIHSVDAVGARKKAMMKVRTAAKVEVKELPSVK